MRQDHDLQLEAALSSLRQLRLKPNEKETVRRAVLLKMAETPVSVVRGAADERLQEHMDPLTSSFLANCKSLTLAEAESFEVKTSLLSYMQAKPRAANAPVISYLSVLGTVTMDVAEKQLARDALVAAMQASAPQPAKAQEERCEEGFVSLFSSMLGGRSVLAFA